jgi:hypothetical protein
MRLSRLSANHDIGIIWVVTQSSAISPHTMV